jgi:hypothetical protein
MTLEKRIVRLEQRYAPPPPPVTFERIEAPPGLSREQHAAWLAELRKNGPVFTLNLASASLARLHE